MIYWGSRDDCVGLLFEPFSNWLHVLLKLRQFIFRGSRSVLSIYCLSTAEYRESMPPILRFGTGAVTGLGAFLLLPFCPWRCRMLVSPMSTQTALRDRIENVGVGN